MYYFYYWWNKILSEKIKSFDIIPTKAQLFDISERIDLVIKEIKSEVNILYWFSSYYDKIFKKMFQIN